MKIVKLFASVTLVASLLLTGCAATNPTSVASTVGAVNAAGAKPSGATSAAHVINAQNQRDVLIADAQAKQAIAAGNKAATEDQYTQLNAGLGAVANVGDTITRVGTQLKFLDFMY
ncbi:MAG: hypothetical protein QJT81_01940 [Candidatus Thiothrix putei]|uniref:Lipoprotein n=1 Tax=Candidatus Thiothrix putei TaxID=3080811 RepID=A0AA95HFZ5_9GAMM|nr:MAG: hypothetical protein QJT81_01940 [Candidatus Thiothrix putei]